MAEAPRIGGPVALPMATGPGVATRGAAGQGSGLTQLGFLATTQIR